MQCLCYKCCERSAMSIGVRLAEERKRIGHSQDEWASLTGIHRNTQIKYERGDVVPDANYLSIIETVGADISYIVSGSKGVIVKQAEVLGRECAIVFNVVELLEISLGKNRKFLSPQKKARAASMLFRLAYPSNTVDEQMVEEIINLAE